MASLASSHSTGDSISRDIVKMSPGTTDLSSLVPELLNDHAHRPGLWSQDLQEVNQTLHQQGILPGCDIVGVRGQDLVASTSDGHSFLINDDDTTETRELSTPNTVPLSGSSESSMVSQNADGSGLYKVGSDTNDWNVSARILKQQGIENPTDNQIANYDKELASVNPNLADASGLNLKSGDVLNIPAQVIDGDQTAFWSNNASAAQQQVDQALAPMKGVTQPMPGDDSYPSEGNRFGYGYSQGYPNSYEDPGRYEDQGREAYPPNYYSYSDGATSENDSRDAGADLAAAAGDLGAAAISAPVGLAKGLASWIMGGADEIGQGIEDMANGEVGRGAMETAGGTLEQMFAPIGGLVGAAEGVGGNLQNAATDAWSGLERIWDSI